jgi:hypothetical protein
VMANGSLFDAPPTRVSPSRREDAAGRAPPPRNRDKRERASSRMSRPRVLGVSTRAPSSRREREFPEQTKTGALFAIRGGRGGVSFSRRRVTSIRVSPFGESKRTLSIQPSYRLTAVSWLCPIP